MDDTTEITNSSRRRGSGGRVVLKLIFDTIGHTGVIILGSLISLYLAYKLFLRLTGLNLYGLILCAYKTGRLYILIPYPLAAIQYSNIFIPEVLISVLNQALLINLRVVHGYDTWVRN